MKEGRIDNYTLRSLCIKNQWFTCGDNDQYENLFYANDMNAPITDIALIIWICSDTKRVCQRDILVELNEAGFTERNETSEKEHLQAWLGI